MSDDLGINLDALCVGEVSDRLACVCRGGLVPNEGNSSERRTVAEIVGLSSEHLLRLGQWATGEGRGRVPGQLRFVLGELVQIELSIARAGDDPSVVVEDAWVTPRLRLRDSPMACAMLAGSQEAGVALMDRLRADGPLDLPPVPERPRRVRAPLWGS